MHEVLAPMILTLERETEGGGLLPASHPLACLLATGEARGGVEADAFLLFEKVMEEIEVGASGGASLVCVLCHYV